MVQVLGLVAMIIYANMKDWLFQIIEILLMKVAGVATKKQYRQEIV